jgi:type IV secretory pathway VirB2 component (pilin)
VPDAIQLAGNRATTITRIFRPIRAKNSCPPNIHWTASLSEVNFAPKAGHFERLLEVRMPRWFQVHLIPRIETILRSQRSRLATALFAFLLLMPMAAVAQGSPFDTGFNAIQGLFTGTIAKVASLVAIVIGGYGFAHGEPGAKKALAGVAAGTGIAVMAVNVLSWLWGV